MDPTEERVLKFVEVFARVQLVLENGFGQVHQRLLPFPGWGLQDLCGSQCWLVGTATFFQWLLDSDQFASLYQFF